MMVDYRATAVSLYVSLFIVEWLSTVSQIRCCLHQVFLKWWVAQSNLVATNNFQFFCHPFVNLLRLYTLQHFRSCAVNLISDLPAFLTFCLVYSIFKNYSAILFLPRQQNESIKFIFSNFSFLSLFCFKIAAFPTSFLMEEHFYSFTNRPHISKMCTPSIYYTFSLFNISGQIQKQSSIERFSVGLKS